METEKNWVQHALINLLLEQNSHLNDQTARTWVEAIWEDIEATRAKGGYKYRGIEQTSQQVEQWIRSHGKHVHFLSDDPVAYIRSKNQKGPLS